MSAANKHTILTFLTAAKKYAILTFLAAANKYTILTFLGAANKYTILMFLAAGNIILKFVQLLIVSTLSENSKLLLIQYNFSCQQGFRVRLCTYLALIAKAVE